MIAPAGSRGRKLPASLLGRSAASRELAVLLGMHTASETGKEPVVFSKSLWTAKQWWQTDVFRRKSLKGKKKKFEGP